LKFNVPFQHKYGYIRDERSGMKNQGWRAIRTQLKIYINLNPGRLMTDEVNNLKQLLRL